MAVLTGYHKIIAEIADKIGVEPALALAIAETESSFDPLACRYEPIFRWTNPKAERPKNSTIETEIQHQKTSWGLMQVMGIVARENGLRGWITQLTQPEVGAEFGCRVIKKKLEKYSDLDSAISAYNAGSPTDTNKGYVAKVKSKLEKWRAQA